jgi:bis(5'-nucleosyl)-tetraphosphatase (symmetrical)
MRWFVGDIHGCSDVFERLLERIRFEPARDELWSVGDLVNTGPDSAGVLRLWIETGGRGVLGNHDAHALRVQAGTRKLREEDTLQQLLQAPDVDTLMGAMRSMPLLVHHPGAGGARDVWLVHAGLHPVWGNLHAVAGSVNAGFHDESWLLGPEVRFATRARCCTPNGKMLDLPGPPGDCVAPYRPWDSYYDGDALVVHGHWAQRGHYRSERTLGLDSGCVYGGPLTAWCQDEDRIVQVHHQ